MTTSEEPTIQQTSAGVKAVLNCAEISQGLPIIDIEAKNKSVCMS